MFGTRYSDLGTFVPTRGIEGLHIVAGMEHHHQIIDDLRQPTRDLRDAIPEVWQGFAALHKAAVADGAIPAHIKELMAMAIGLAQGCDGCIAYHAKAASRKGATEQEAAEAIGVALLMAGGPASVEGPRALEAFKEFKADTEALAGSKSS